MPAMSKCILMPLVRGAEIRRWAAQKDTHTKIHLAVDAHGMPVRFFITSGTTADCTIADRLIEGFQAEYLLVDRGYDTTQPFSKLLTKEWYRSFRQEKNVNICGNMTSISTSSDLSLRMLSCFSKGGAVSLHATQKMPLLLLPLFKFVIFLFGSSFIDDTI